MSENELPSFPVDDATLDLFEAALRPREHGDPEAQQSSVWPLLTFLSQMGGSDTDAVQEQVDENTFVMRDQHYHDNDAHLAFIQEIRRLRGELTATQNSRLISAVFGHHKGAPKPFALYRSPDKTVVALGAEFPDGATALRMNNDDHWYMASDGGAQYWGAGAGRSGLEIVWLSDEQESLAELAAKVAILSNQCVCSSSVHEGAPGRVELHADAECPVHGEYPQLRLEVHALRARVAELEQERATVIEQYYEQKVIIQAAERWRAEQVSVPRPDDEYGEHEIALIAAVDASGKPERVWTELALLVAVAADEIWHEYDHDHVIHESALDGEQTEIDDLFRKIHHLATCDGGSMYRLTDEGKRRLATLYGAKEESP